MDANKVRRISDATDIEANGWKSMDRRNMMVKKIAEFFIERGPPSWSQNVPALLKSVEKFEQQVFGSAKDEAEYVAMISAKMKAIRGPLQNNESNLLSSKALGSEKEVNAKWQEHIYDKIQVIKDTYLTKLDHLYKGLCRRFEQLEAIPQQSKTREMIRCEQHKHALEYIFAMFKANKSQITHDFEEKLDKMEKYILSIEKRKNIYSQSKNFQVEGTSEKKPTSTIMAPQTLHLTKPDFQPNKSQLEDQVENLFSNSIPQVKQVSIKEKEDTFQKKPTPIMGLQSSHLTNSDFQPNKMYLEDQMVNLFNSSTTQAKHVSTKEQVEGTSGKKPMSPVMDLQSFHLEKQDFQLNQMCLEDQVAYLFNNPIPHEKQVPNKEQGYGSGVQQQTSDDVTLLDISTSRILPSPLLENCNEEKEDCQDHIVILDDDSSPAMQHLTKVLNSVSAEALVASCEDIGMLFHLNDDMSTLEPLNGPPIGAIGTNLEGNFVTDSQAKYMTRDNFVPRERKMNCFINSMPIRDNFMQLTSSEKPFSNLSTTQVNYTHLLEEIKEINNLLIDTEVVVDKEKIFVAPIEGLTVKLFFNAVSVNVNPISNQTSFKKSLIKPLWLHIPSSYPYCSVDILDEMSSETRMDIDDLSIKARLKLKISLRTQSQPLSLKDIAISWDYCAREAICEYAQLHGGGTFTSNYGGWKTC